MEIVDPSEQNQHHHTWLEWLGLQEPPPEADAWVAVARGFEPDDPATGTSRLAAHLVEDLSHAGVEARQRSYQFYDAVIGAGVPITGMLSTAGMVTCVAVMCHERNLVQAVAVANGAKAELDTEADEPLSGEMTDAELTRQAMAAGPPPPD